MNGKTYLELRILKSVQTDEFGNWIIEGEASNENLDVQEQEVLQEALVSSKNYFLENGVISYDHRHNRPDPEDPNWNPEKYIIGEPLDVYTNGKKTFVKAKLYKNNDIAKEIVNKLESGSTRIKSSVGGRKPVYEKRWDGKLKKMVEKVVSVLWDELAITFKPVNQTLGSWALSSAEFVKSLSAGYGTDSSAMTGGRALIKQDIEDKRATGLVAAMSYGDIGEKAEAIDYLEKCGYSPDEVQEILHYVVSNKEKIKEGIPMDEELLKSFDESMNALEKSLKKAKPQANEDDDDELELEDGEEEVITDDGEEELEKGRCKKSIDDDDEVYLDAAPIISKLTKSIQAQQKQIDELLSLQKSIGKAVQVTGSVVKSIADTPRNRQGVLQKSERTFAGSNGERVTMTNAEILAKSNQLVRDGKMDLKQATIIEGRISKGIPLPDETLRMIKSM